MFRELFTEQLAVAALYRKQNLRNTVNMSYFIRLLTLTIRSIRLGLLKV